MESSACFQPVKLELNSACHGCLSGGRNLKPLQGCVQKIFSILSFPSVKDYNVTSVLLCWECTAYLRRIQKFRHKVQKAQLLLQHYYSTELHPLEQSAASLSTLSTIQINNEITIKYEEITNEFEEIRKDDTTIDVKHVNTDSNICEKLLNTDSNIDIKDIVCKQENTDSDEPVEDDFVQYESSNEIDIKKEFSNKNVDRKKKILKTTRKNSLRAKITLNTDLDFTDPDKYVEVTYLSVQKIEECVKRDIKGVPTKKLHYGCKSCKSRYRLSKDLKRHKTFHHVQPSGPYTCLECHAVVDTQLELERHWDQHNYVVKCTICGEMRNRRRDMANHIASHKKVYTCVECGVPFYTLGDFSKHYNDLHKTLICDYCGWRSTNKRTLLKHMRSRHLPKSCVHCGRTFSRRSSLFEHYRAAHRGLPLPDDGHGPGAVDLSLAYCVECDKQYPSVYKYKKHVYNSHVNKRKKINVPCPECGKVFSRTNYMKNHYKLIHAGKSKHYCALCDKYFVTAFSARQHQKGVHEKVLAPRNKICDICGRGFATNKVLIHHRRTHTGERPHACAHCPAAFAQQTALKTHVRTQHKHALNS